MLISVILTTYNRPSALKLVLMALKNQTDANFEVVIADDGSKAETRSMIEALKPTLGYPLIHVWQEDCGFRAARARNLAVLASSGKYLVFLDGDSVPRRDFIANHRKLAEIGWVVAGNRILLSKKFTETVEKTFEPIYEWSLKRWITCFMNRGINRLFPLISLPSFHCGRKLSSNSWKKVRTCNLGIWREDFEAVNGFDCAYEGWGYEDSDLAIRLLNFGVKRKNGSFATGVIHLWHNEFDRSHKDENFDRLRKRLEMGDIKANYGVIELKEETSQTEIR